MWHACLNSVAQPENMTSSRTVVAGLARPGGAVHKIADVPAMKSANPAYLACMSLCNVICPSSPFMTIQLLSRAPGCEQEPGSWLCNICRHLRRSYTDCASMIDRGTEYEIRVETENALFIEMVWCVRKHRDPLTTSPVMQL